MEEGKLIVLEGACDGIGKSTQIALLIDKLKKADKEYVTHHYPSYNEPQAKIAEMYQDGELGDHKKLSPYFIYSSYALDRAVSWIKELKEEYESGKVILCDRYSTSSLIYQSTLFDDEIEKEKFINFVFDYEYDLLKNKKPDLVIFLTAPYDIIESFSRKREEETSDKKSVHENDLSYMRKVYDNANELAKRFNWKIVNYMDGERVKTVDEISEEIASIINEKLGLNI